MSNEETVNETKRSGYKWSDQQKENLRQKMISYYNNPSNVAYWKDVKLTDLHKQKIKVTQMLKYHGDQSPKYLEAKQTLERMVAELENQ